MEPYNAIQTPLADGITLIEASAGTGKTWSIAALYLRLVLEERIPVTAILAVTYTVAATSELRDRIRTRLRNALQALRAGDETDEVVGRYLGDGRSRSDGIRDLELAVQSFDEARIFTIHGFCQRILQDHAFESGARYGCEIVTDSRALLEEIANDFWRIQFHNAPAHFAALALARGESPDAWLDLLQRTRNHPDLRILPEPEAVSRETLVAALEAALDSVIQEWRADEAEITNILRTDDALQRSEKTFRSDRLERLLAALGRLGEDPDLPCDEECIEAIQSFCEDGLADAVKSGRTPPGHPFFAACQAFCHEAERRFRALTHEFLRYAADELPRRKLLRNALTFDDLLTLVYRALNEEGNGLTDAVGGAYRAALIDEFQDTDPLQYSIFTRLFDAPDRRLFFIGDPKQSIYGFRGADVFTYLQAANSAAHRFTLGQNWRSVPALLDGFNALFTRRPDPFVFEKIEYPTVRAALPAPKPPASLPPLRFHYLLAPVEEGKPAPFSQDEASRQSAEATAREIAARRDKRGRIAVLVRKHWQAETMQIALRRHGVRAVLHTEASVFHTGEAADLQRLLEAVLAPADPARLHAALLTPALGLDANAVATLAPEVHREWLERFLEWRDLWRNGCFAATFRRVLGGHDVRRRFMERPGGERRLTDLLHLAELLHEAETTRRLTPEALIEWLGEQRAATRPPSESAQLRLESDGDAVTIVTVHKSKGLEYDVVFCPFAWLAADSPKRQTVQFHDEQGRMTLDLRGKAGADDDHIARHKREALAEEVRLLYVAVTRARHECVVFAGDIRGMTDSALAHLLNAGEGGPLEEFERLASEYPEAVACSTFEPCDDPETAPPLTETTPEPGSDLSARIFPAAPAYPIYLTSFSALTAGGTGEAFHTEAADPPERDRALESRPPAEPIPTPGQTPSDDAVFRFERGTRAGDFFHDVLEHLDFTTPGSIEECVGGRLTAHGFSRSQWTKPITAKVRDVLEVELAPGLRLSSIEKSNRLSELEFSCRLKALRPDDLRTIFAGHDTPALDATDLGRLRFAPVEGFLRGFIDLVFCHDGRYYLADWKSNWLGDNPAAYDEPGVAACMREHRYTLQAHLYVLALDRFLAQRLPEYDYERHFGGLFYIFLRGVDPNWPARAIFRDRPSLALVNRLRQLVS